MKAEQNRFTQTHDAAGALLTVIDSTTGLEWTAKPLSDDYITHQVATDAATGCRVGGHEDWALPSRQQLLTLVDLTRHSPAIDTDAFPDFPSRWFWTSDLCAGSSASAWFVDFYLGFVSYFHRSFNGFALAVRRAGQ
ncbi:DUF1566 domain-containing protein [Stenotrophomonas sp. PS02298]|uniref:Lcl C-terminal domain-containing protein n=1 Tax=Stenotrophomonas sp. PS02298 TaxID=2991424 RepID=UPI002499D229|nr:DUF1566 domain-containing protein [Stenotrophomonas sp. PS02298]